MEYVDRYPEWVVFVVSVAVVMLAIAIGNRRGLRAVAAAKAEPEGATGSVVGAVLGLLAFILAFTFGIAANRFDSRKQLLLDDVNALETAALRADLISEPHRTEAGRLIRRYVDLRVSIIGHPEKLPAASVESRHIERQLWAHAMELARLDLNSDIGALFVEAINDVVRSHNSRFVVAVQYRIAPVIWAGLGFITILSMWAVGYHFGLAGGTGIRVHLLLALTFSAVVTMIAMLDRPAGLLRVNQQPMIDLQTRLGAPVAP